MNHLFLCLALFHVLGDFYLPPAGRRRAGRRPCRGMLLHGAIYAAATFLPLYALGFLPAAYAAAFAASAGLAHFAVDAAMRAVIKKRNGPRAALLVFLSDQALHMACLIGIAACLRPVLSAAPWFVSVPNAIAYVKGARLLTAMLIGYRPASVAVRLVLELLPQREQADAGDAPAKTDAGAGGGRLIGILERETIILLVFCQQFGVIGFVLAAKSIARYKQLEQQSFAEQYLVGTLTSALLALCASLLTGRL